MWQFTLPTESPFLASCPTALDCRAESRHGYHRYPVARVLVKPLFRRQAALVRDLSAYGVGLIAAGRINPGASVLIELCSRAGDALTWAGQAVYATAQADGRWHIGCRLMGRLSDADLDRALDLDD
jgi:hypothetical protein